MAAEGPGARFFATVLKPGINGLDSVLNQWKSLQFEVIQVFKYD